MNILYFTHPLNGLLMIAFPIGLGIFLRRKFHLNWKLWLIGAATFTLSQVLHIPFNALLTQLFQNGTLPSPPQNWSLTFNAVVLGLSAGFFEEFARYFTYRWWAKDARSWAKGVMLGAGHGGIEAIILGLLVVFAFVQMLALRGIDLASVIPPEQLELARTQVEQYWSMPWYLSLLGFLERLLTIPVHIALSVMVLQVFTRRRIIWLWLAIAFHALLDAVAVFASSTWGNTVTEFVIMGFTVISLLIIFALRGKEEIPAPLTETETEPQPTHTFSIPSVDENPDNLDNTRYSG